MRKKGEKEQKNASLTCTDSKHKDKILNDLSLSATVLRQETVSATFEYPSNKKY